MFLALTKLISSVRFLKYLGETLFVCLIDLGKVGVDIITGWVFAMRLLNFCVKFKLWRAEVSKRDKAVFETKGRFLSRFERINIDKLKL